MIKFPDWVNSPKRQTRRQLAVKRLRYMVLRAAIEAGAGGSVTTFAQKLGMERTTIHMYIKNGEFTAQCAARAEQIFGSELVRAEWLRKPLAIEV